MKNSKKLRGGENLILARLGYDDLALLRPHLQPVELPLRLQLEKAEKKAEYVYFVERGIVSVVATGVREVEVGIIGCDGMTGMSVILGAKKVTGYETYVQVAGSGQRIAVEALRNAMEQSATLRQYFLLYVYSFLGQVTQTAVANARGSLVQRLARWLLMVNDRSDNDAVPLTHEFLAVMLAVNRPGVTVTLTSLEQLKAIAQRRGAIDIIDRSALEKIASDVYLKTA